MTTYFPADMPDVIFGANLHYKNRQKILWMQPDSEKKYPYILFSAYYGMKYPNIKKDLNIREDVEIFGDSGGFQNFSFGANLNAIDVLRWQEENCTIGATFDYPLCSTDSYEEVRKKQEKTVENAFIALKNKKKENLKLYAAIQAKTKRDYDYLQELYEKQENFKDFNGFAIGGYGEETGNMSNIVFNILCGIDWLKKYKKPIHFFGLSSFFHAALFIYIEKKFNIPISFDSSTFSVGRSKRLFTLSNSGFKLTINNETKLKYLPCNCFICRNFSIEELKNMNTGEAGHLIATHNLHEMLGRYHMLNSLIEDIDTYKEFCRKNFGDKIIKFFDFIDLSEKEGIEKASSKLNINLERPSKQATVFG